MHILNYFPLPSGLLLAGSNECFPSGGHITFPEPFTGLDQLDHIDHLLASHDGEADAG